MLKNRVREVRKQRGLTLEQLAELAGMSAGHLSRIERHEKGWSMESLPKLAQALGVPPEQLIDASGAWQMAPVIASLGQTAWGHLIEHGNGSGAAVATVKVPAAYGDVVAVTIIGTAFYPRYNTGDVILAAEPSGEPAQFVGKECVVVSPDGDVSIKFVQKAADGPSFILISHNEPPSSDRIVARCYPVVAVIR